VFEHFGLLRHVLRHLQWAHGLVAMEVAEQLLVSAEEQPGRYPLLNWVSRYFDLYAIPPLGWDVFYEEVRRHLVTELGVPDDPELDTVLGVQRFLMPEIGRTFPASLDLAHDYVSWYQEATAELYRSGTATGPSRPLSSYGPATLVVHGDPAGLCNWRMRPWDDSRDETYVRPFWVSAVFELDSPLTRNLPETRLAGEWQSIEEREEELARLRDQEEPATAVLVRSGAA
jgi:hypothetical protein